MPTPCRLSGDGVIGSAPTTPESVGGCSCSVPTLAKVAFPSWRRSALPSVVTALMVADAGSPEVRDENGMTPLHYAAAYGETLSGIAVLPEVGADPETPNKDG